MELAARFDEVYHSSPVVKNVVDSVQDFKWITGETPLTSWQFLTGVHIVYAAVLTLVIWYASNIEKKPQWITGFAFYHNSAMALLSGSILVGILGGAYLDGRFESIDRLVCQRAPTDQIMGLLPFSMYLFYLSKMTEFVDTFILVLSKKRLTWLHCIHHLTTMSLVWHAMKVDLSSDIVSAGLNCFVHVIMYAYFAKPIALFRKSITYSQLSQFVLVLAAVGYAAFRRYSPNHTACQGTRIAEAHGLLMYGVYFVMFANFFIQQYMRNRSRAAAVRSSAKKGGKGGKTSTRSVTSASARNGKDEVGVQQEVLLYNRIYDVSEFIKSHPGGSIIKFAINNGDATATYREFHARFERPMEILKSLPSRPYDPKNLDDAVFGPKAGGEKKDFARTSKLLKDFQALRTSFEKEGLFKPSYTHVAYRYAELIAMHVLGIFLVFGQSYIRDALASYNVEETLTVALSTAYSLNVSLITVARWFGIVVLGIAQGRCGWAMHEAGHYSLTGMIGLDQFLQAVTYGLGCGMSGAYWRNQHNKHHAAPQQLKHDVDLDTLPFVAFNARIAQKARGLVRVWLRFQAALFVPVSTTLVALGWQVFLHPRHSMRTGKYVELFSYVLRYALWGYFFGQAFGWQSAVGMYLAYMVVGGGYIFSNFAVSHTHKPVVEEDEQVDWVTFAAKYTTNCHPTFITSWWMGYLNFQIEHHLFPTMPQFRHAIIASRVEKFLVSHDLPYDSRGYWRAVFDTVKNLHAVGATKSVPRAPKEKIVVYIDGKQVDVSNWARNHPGGSKTLRIYNQRDATELFYAYHSPDAIKRMQRMAKGAQDVPADFVQVSQSKLGLALKELKLKAAKMGLFKASPLHEIAKVVTIGSMYIIANVLFKTTDYFYTASCFLALAMQQSGWLAHDYCHHSVFNSVAANDTVGQVWGYLQGYEMAWWKARHNTHHVVTNEEGNDPDIKTAPVLTFVNKITGAVSSRLETKTLNAIQKLQHFYFIPLLGMLHVYWRIESPISHHGVGPLPTSILAHSASLQHQH
eukprot:TRINITY_DN1779_c0_g1_i1.p1 TRINITY_DN1779_c0_g1~~TRINITY_DN1779_c0_g1_i1.p1  ORF type:complete len:1103 (+),score=271.00 TRINITY_DN1779_c0_g1_i1:233-3310(+)